MVNEAERRNPIITLYERDLRSLGITLTLGDVIEYNMDLLDNPDPNKSMILFIPDFQKKPKYERQTYEPNGCYSGACLK